MSTEPPVDPTTREVAELLGRLRATLAPAFRDAAGDLVRALRDANAHLVGSTAFGHMLAGRDAEAETLLVTLSDDERSRVLGAAAALFELLANDGAAPDTDDRVSMTYAALGAGTILGHVYDGHTTAAVQRLDQLDDHELFKVQRAASDLLTAVTARQVRENGWTANNVIMGVCGADGLCPTCRGEDRAGTDGCGSHYRAAVRIDPLTPPRAPSGAPGE